MEFSVTGDQQVELTAMSLDESEGCLLTACVIWHHVQMWNYSVGECLLTFPARTRLEVSLAHRVPGALTAPVTPSTCYFSHISLRFVHTDFWLCASLSLCA